MIKKEKFILKEKNKDGKPLKYEEFCKNFILNKKKHSYRVLFLFLLKMALINKNIQRGVIVINFKCGLTKF